MVVSPTAEDNEELLHRADRVENADKVGEFSLTDARLSPIHSFMANTLFDENTGGPYGNTHLALGLALPRRLRRRPATLSAEDRVERLGINQSAVHTTSSRPPTVRSPRHSRRLRSA